VYILQQKVQEYCEEDILDGSCLLEIGWYTEEMIAMYVECERCGRKECHAKENREQGVIRDKQRWCGCIGKAVQCHAVRGYFMMSAIE